MLVKQKHSAPASLDEHVTLRLMLPSWLNPNGMLVGRTLPMAFDPDMPAFPPHVVTFNPNVLVRGALAFDDHFVPRWRWRLGDEF